MNRGLTYAWLALCVLLASCEHHPEKPAISQPPSEVKEYPSQEGWNSQLFITRAGHRQAVLRYGHMRQFEKRKMIFFDQGVEVDFYNRQGGHTSNLTADRGEYNEKTEDVRGMGNVVVVSDSGLTLLTEELHWDNQKGRIFSDTLVTFISESGDTLYGRGFESNADLTRRVIYQPWGVSHERIDFDAIEKSFSRTKTDSTARDSLAADSVSGTAVLPDSMATIAADSVEALP